MRRALMLLLALGACKPEAHETKPAPSATVSASASASAKPAGPVRYAGTYTAKPSELYVPDGDVYKGFKFRGEDAGVALGEGNIVLTVDPSGGVTGTLEGPLGPATLSGVADDAGVTFHVAPSDPKADLALSGTGNGTVSPSELKGSMQLSSWRANILREATFTAKTGK